MKNATTAIGDASNSSSNSGRLRKSKKTDYYREINKFVSRFQSATGISPTKTGRENLKRYLHYRVMFDMPHGELNIKQDAVGRWLRKNIDQNVGLALLQAKKASKAIRLLSLNESRLLFQNLSGNMYGLMCLLISFFGLRLKEVVALKVGDVDIDQQTIYLPESENSSTRSVKLAKEICDQLNCYIAYRDRNEYIFSLRRDASSQQSLPVSPRTLQLYLNRLCRELGLGHITTQTLRDNYIVYMLRKGVSPKIIVQRMGFKNSRSIARYMDYVEEKNLELPSPLNEVLC